MRAWWLLLILPGCATFWTGDIAAVPAPAIDAVAVDGSPVGLPDRGVVLVDFMGTWCGPCQRAVPVLRDLQAAYPGLQVVSVSATDTPGQLQAFQGQYGATWPHIADTHGIAEAYRENGTRAPAMMWPSYALVVDGDLVFYNRGETLPATFAAAIDRHTGRAAPPVAPAAFLPAAAAFVLGALAWHSPWLLAVVQEAPRRRPAASAWLGALVFTGIGLAAAFGSRPLSGRVATAAPFLAIAGVVAFAWWRWRGAEPPEGRWLSGQGWRHGIALHGNALWYGLPAWGAVLHAALLRTAPIESLAIVASFGVGITAADMLAQRHRLPDAASLGAAALLLGALWNAALYIR